MANKRSAAAHESVRAYREKMKQQGFRQISVWVPDTKSPKIRKECRRQSRLEVLPIDRCRWTIC